MSTITKAQRTESADNLRELLHPGDTVYVVQRHVSRSGMMRRLDLYVIRDNDLRRITWDVSNVLGWGLNNQGIRVDGAGMDMHFHTVYTLGRVLWPEGVRVPDYTGSMFERDGGYALSHRTI